MKSITPISGNQTSFGMAVKFNKGGRKFFNDVFKDNPNAAEQYILRQKNNKTSDIYVHDNKVSVKIDGIKWNIIGYIANSKYDGEHIDEILLIRKLPLLNRLGYKTLIRESKKDILRPQNQKEGLLYVAEDIANFESYKTGNKKTPLLSKIKAIFKSMNS